MRLRESGCGFEFLGRQAFRPPPGYGACYLITSAAGRGYRAVPDHGA